MPNSDDCSLMEGYSGKLIFSRISLGRLNEKTLSQNSLSQEGKRAVYLLVSLFLVSHYQSSPCEFGTHTVLSMLPWKNWSQNSAELIMVGEWEPRESGQAKPGHQHCCGSHQAAKCHVEKQTLPGSEAKTAWSLQVTW